MKYIRILAILLFVAIIAVPLFGFNVTPDAISLIDNRKLTENPFTLDGSITYNIENYVSDRIGFRDEMITAYTILNDRLFGKMVHPSYTYGKDGFVFGAGMTTSNGFGDYHIAFADMVAEVQAYCQERNVPFLFVFHPAKPAVYQDKIADGVNYNRQWVDRFFEALEERGIHYLDNTETLTQLREQGIDGFNQKFDANHWNDLGAFYCTQAILERLQEMSGNVHVNQLEEFTISEKLETSLHVSKFPINEYVPTLSLNVAATSLYDAYFPELQLHKSHQSFGYFRNDSENVKDTPKTLVFQGSYMNGYGYKYLINAFEEYIYVHDYENVLNFPYYFNIFQPECVVFEVAEYTIASNYFDFETMKAVDFNPALSAEEGTCKAIDVTSERIVAENGNTLTTVTWYTDQTYSYVWCSFDQVYDMEKVEEGYRVTIETGRYESGQEPMRIYTSVA